MGFDWTGGFPYPVNIAVEGGNGEDRDSYKKPRVRKSKVGAL